MWVSLEGQGPGPSQAGLGCQLLDYMVQQLGTAKTLDPGDGQSLGSSWHHGVARAGCSRDNLERLSLETWREGQGWWEQQEGRKGKGGDGRRV